MLCGSESDDERMNQHQETFFVLFIYRELHSVLYLNIASKLLSKSAPRSGTTDAEM